jgi:hypothetical protein
MNPSVSRTVDLWRKKANPLKEVMPKSGIGPAIKLNPRLWVQLDVVVHVF